MESVESNGKSNGLGNGGSPNPSFGFGPPFSQGPPSLGAVGPSNLFTNFVQSSHDRFSQLLEERRLAHIPPPAGFGTPTRPASLLKDIWLNDACQSGNQRYTTSAVGAGGSTSSVSETSSPTKVQDGSNRNGGGNGGRSTWNSELPVSPLSPPSPFQHPFFRRQLGLNADPWTRFSGFGMPRLTPLMHQNNNGDQHPEPNVNHGTNGSSATANRMHQTQDLHQRRSDSNILSGRVIKIQHTRSGSADGIIDSLTGANGGRVAYGEGNGEDEEVLVVERTEEGNEGTGGKDISVGGDRGPVGGGLNARKGHYRVTSCQSAVRFCTKTQTYKMCRETQFYTHSFGEGVSETESEEDDEDNVPTPTPSLHGSSCQSLATRSSRRRLGSVEATNISKGAESASSSASFDRSDNRFRDQSTSSGQSFASSTPSCSSVVPRFVGGSSLAEESRRRGGGEGGREDDRGKEDEKDIRGGGGAARGVARTHSQFSDLDREGAGSKRNSQAISSEASEVDDLSSLTNSDLESCVDASSPRSSLLQEGGGHPDQSPSYGDAPRPGSGPGVGPPSSGDASVSMQLSRPGSGDLYQDSAMPQSGTRRNRISTSSFEGRPGRPLSSSSGVGKFPDDVGRSSRPSNSSRSSHYDTAENSTNYSEQHQQYHENSDRNGSSSNSNNNYANTHRNSYTNKDQFTSSSFEGTNNPSGLPSSTTCPEFYNQASSNEESTGQFTGKIHHNRSDQDLHGQKQKSLQQQKENKNSHPSSLDSHKPQTSACGETTTVLQESHKHNRVPLRQKHPSGGSIEPEDEDSTDRRVRHRSGEGEVLSGYGSGDNLEGAEMSLGSEDQSQQDPRQTKAYRIALELLSTEETYVQVLHLIDQEFQFRVDQENRAHPMFSADHIPQMFSNVKSIYKLHHDFLLPQLQERLHQWDTCPRIGDIMTKLAPFLKMYTEYVKNFDHAMTVINSCQTKCPRFGTIMTQIHQLESCGNLTLQHHMLSPVQRIPRYELLLRDYLRKLPAHHQDRHDTTKALHLVATAASHANEAMKKIDKFQKLLEVQDNISGCVDLVSPTRELIKQGKIIKISARSGDHQERYLYLLSDLLLLCSPRLGGRVIHGPQHRLRARYNVENLHVVEGDNLETANTFYIRDSSKTVELYTQTFEEKEAWLAALFCAIEETYRRKSSLKLSGAPYGSDDDFDSSMSGGSELGNEQPLLMPVEGVAKCMKCGAQFNMVRRKHHCRACGSVVCNKCSSYKAALACEGGRSVKVCRSCHARLTQASSGSLGQPQTAGEEGLDPGGGLTGDGSACSSRMSVDGSDLVLRTRGVLEVPASAAGAIIQGHLQLKTHRKAWQSRWFALHTDFVLYSFRSNADDSALTATPLPGYTVTLLQGTRSDGSGVCDKDRERAFKLHYSKKQYVFLAASKEECARWTLQLQRASRAEIPPPDEVQ